MRWEGGPRGGTGSSESAPLRVLGKAACRAPRHAAGGGKASMAIPGGGQDVLQEGADMHGSGTSQVLVQKLATLPRSRLDAGAAGAGVARPRSVSPARRSRPGCLVRQFTPLRMYWYGPDGHISRISRLSQRSHGASAAWSDFSAKQSAVGPEMSSP